MIFHSYVSHYQRVTYVVGNFFLPLWWNFTILLVSLRATQEEATKGLAKARARVNKTMVICTAAKEALKPVRESGKSVRNLEIKNEKYPSCSPKKTYLYTYYCWSMFMYDYHIHLWRSFQPCDWWPVDLSSEKRGFAPTAMFIGWKNTPCPSPRNRGLSEKSSTLWLCQNSYWTWTIYSWFTY